MTSIQINLPELEYKKNSNDKENEILHFSGVPVRNLAREFKTPLYAYSANHITKQIKELQTALVNQKHIICYSVKANSNLSILKLIKDLGCGADIVSGGELFRCKKAGMQTSKIIFAGVGKNKNEIEEALNSKIMLFSVESEFELAMINEIAGKLNLKASVSLRINPDVNVETHSYITTGSKENKFGISHEKLIEIIKNAKYNFINLDIIGLGFHIGSQILETDSFGQAASLVLKLMFELKNFGITWKYLDVGGGLGIRYENENPPEAKTYINKILNSLNFSKYGLNDITLILEPGRFIVGNAGILITQIINKKISTNKKFLICDAAMNDLIRPAMYQAFHQIIPETNYLNTLNPPIENSKENSKEVYDLVGPICESGDFFAKSISLNKNLKENDLLVVATCGAYGMSMSSNYNSRPRAAEVLIESDENNLYKVRLIRQRETYENLIEREYGL